MSGHVRIIISSLQVSSETVLYHLSKKKLVHVEIIR